jgi:hypothetical protein
MATFEQKYKYVMAGKSDGEKLDWLYAQSSDVAEKIQVLEEEFGEIHNAIIQVRVSLCRESGRE